MKQILSALVKAQKEFNPAIKSSVNPAFARGNSGGKYADLASCIDAVLDALNNHGIALIQHTHECNDGVIVETIFYHESGESLSCGRLHVPAGKNDPQGYGSALTYARRYSLMAACGIAPEDDDGNAASKPVATPKPVAKPAELAKPAEKPVAPPVIQGKEGQWKIKVSAAPDGDFTAWVQAVIDATTFALEMAQTEVNIMDIFKNNRNIYDRIQADDKPSYDRLLAVFTKYKNKLIAELSKKENQVEQVS